MDPTERLAFSERLRVIAVEMDRIVQEIGPKWIRLAHLREEARMISTQLEGEDARLGQ